MFSPFALWRAGLLPDYNHFTRAFWRKNHPDPVRITVVMGTLSLYTLAAAVPFLFTSVCLYGGNCPNWLTASWRLGIFLHFFVPAGINFVIYAMWGLDTSDFFGYFKRTCGHLGMTPYWFLSSTLESNRGVAIGELMRLGDIVIEANKTHDDPRHHKRVDAMYKFERAYDVFLKMGIIRNDGYGKYLGRPLTILLSPFDGGSKIKATAGKVSAVGKNPYEALGDLLVHHPEKFGATIDWTQIQGTTW